jgi:hypothetical protein
MKKFTSILLLLLFLFSMYSCVPINKWWAKLTNDVKQEYRLQDADKRIADYEWFEAQYAAIQATRQKVKIASGTENEIGIKMVLVSMIEEYNGKSRMVTRAMWKDKDLPYEIEMGGK